MSICILFTPGCSNEAAFMSIRNNTGGGHGFSCSSNAAISLASVEKRLGGRGGVSLFCMYEAALAFKVERYTGGRGGCDNREVAMILTLQWPCSRT